MKFETSDNIILDYQSVESGQPIILIPGLVGYQQIWRAQRDFLIGQGYQVITYDHRNHGASQRTNRHLTMKRLITDLKELIDYLQLDHVILMGHSMGAGVCYGALHDFPEKIKAVIAVDQTPQMINSKAWSPDFGKWLLANLTLSFKRPLAPIVRHELHLVEGKYPVSFLKNVPLLIDHTKQNWWSTLKHSKIPILVIAAKNSWYFNWHFIEQLNQQTNITTVRLDGGHELMAEDPKAFNRVIQLFLNQIY